MADRPLTFTERESALQEIASKLGEISDRLDDWGERPEDIDTLQQAISALGYTVGWSAGHNDLPPLDMGRPIVAPMPFTFLDQKFLALHQPMLSIDNPNAKDGEKKEIGSVSTGAGLGGDYIYLEWNGVKAIAYGRDLLRAWMSTFTPTEAAHIPHSPASEEPPQ